MATTKKPTAKSTAVAVKKPSNTNIVSIQEALKAQAAAMADRTTPAAGSSIRVTQDKHFVLPDGSKTDELQVVIVDFTSKNSFYEHSFDPKNIAPPACFSIGANPRDMSPSPNAPLAQAADCQSCPNNLFGSDGNGKACKNTRVMAVLPPDADANTPIWILGTSPTANKGFDGYVTSIARAFQMPPIGVITTISFDPKESYSKLVFGDPQPNENVAIHFGRQAEAQAMLNVEPDVSKFVAKPTNGRKTATRR